MNLWHRVSLVTMLFALVVIVVPHPETQLRFYVTFGIAAVVFVWVRDTKDRP